MNPFEAFLAHHAPRLHYLIGRAFFWASYYKARYPLSYWYWKLKQ